EHFQRFYTTNGKAPSCCHIDSLAMDIILRWWKGHLQEMDVKEEYNNEWCSEVKSDPSPEPIWNDLMARRNSIVRCYLQLKVAGESAGAGSSSGSKSNHFPIHARRLRGLWLRNNNNPFKSLKICIKRFKSANVKRKKAAMNPKIWVQLPQTMKTVDIHHLMESANTSIGRKSMFVIIWIHSVPPKPSLKYPYWKRKFENT